MSSRYVALIRAINVGGTSIIKMADLKKVFESMGFTRVETHIQSGNVLFASSEKNIDKIESTIEKKMAATIGRPVKSFVLTAAQLKEAVKHNPFEPEKNEDRQCQYLFLSDKPSKESGKAVMQFQGDEYRFFLHDKVLYYSYAKSLAGNRKTVNFEKILGVDATARTWKVVNKLIELAEM